MWKEVFAVSFAVVVAAVVLYPMYSQVLPGLGEPVTPDSGASTNSTDSSVSSVQTTSTDYAASHSMATQTSTSQGQFDSTWISQFFSVINADRGNSTLAPCAHLDSFAMLRFQTLNTGDNWEIIHYGYSADLQHAYRGTAGSYAEEYLYPATPSYRSPSGFAQFVQTTAPGHWGDLVNPLYRFYGVYAGIGPVLLFPRNCTPSEFSAGVNQTQVPSGCSYQKVSGSWFVVELADTCV